MSAKTDAVVVIDGKVYTLSGYEDVEYLQRIGAYINDKIKEIDSLEASRHMPPNMKNVLIEINLADDFFKARTQVEKLEADLQLKEKELYDLKHDLIANQVKTESLEEQNKELESENRELLLSKTRLETTLEETLLDKKS